MQQLFIGDISFCQNTRSLEVIASRNVEHDEILFRVRLSASRGGIGTMRGASAPFFWHSATATAPIAVAVFPCVTEKRERSRVPRIAGAVYSR